MPSWHFKARKQKKIEVMARHELFQRRYCWEDKIISGWFDDVLRGDRAIVGSHSTGKIIVKRTQEVGKNL